MFIKKYMLIHIFLFMNIFFLPVLFLPLLVSALLFSEMIRVFQSIHQEKSTLVLFIKK